MLAFRSILSKPRDNSIEVAAVGRMPDELEALLSDSSFGRQSIVLEQRLRSSAPGKTDLGTWCGLDRDQSVIHLISAEADFHTGITFKSGCEQAVLSQPPPRNVKPSPRYFVYPNHEVHNWIPP